MSLFNVFNVSGSALNAETVRLNTTASNLANAESVNGDSSKIYRARHPVTLRERRCVTMWRDAADRCRSMRGQTACNGVAIVNVVP